MPNHRLLMAALCAFSAAAIDRADAQPSPVPSASASPSAGPARPAPAASGSASPAASASPSAAPSASPTPYQLFTYQGFVDAGFTSVEGANEARFVTGGAPSRIFDATTGPFSDANGGRLLAPGNNFNDVPDLQNANASVTFNGPLISGKIEGSLGTDADVIASNGQSRSGINLTQAYLQAVKGPVTILAGKFETLAGAELIESPLDSNYSRSYLFGEAIPFTHTGVRATFAATPKIALVVGANNGWDDWKFAGKKKTLEGALLLTPTPGYSLTLDTYNGNDFAAGGISAIGLQPVFTNRMLYDGVLTVHPTSALTLIANYDNATQLAGDTASIGSKHWNGIAGYLNYAFSPLYGVSLRKETFHDVQGFRTGIAQRLQSNTATLSYTPGNFVFRAEYRLDTSDMPVFSYRGLDPASATGRPHQSSIGIESIVKFP